MGCNFISCSPYTKIGVYKGDDKMRYNDVQLRLLILYTLKSFQISMSEYYLQEVLVWSGILDYFTMMDSLYDVMDSKLVETVEIEGETRYSITPKGEEMAEMFKNEIPSSVRSKIRDFADDALDKIERGREIIAEIVPLDRKKYIAKFGMYERQVPFFEVSLFAGTKETAEEVLENLKKYSADIYKLILERIAERKGE